MAGLRDNWARVEADATGLHFIEVEVDWPDLPYPAMVSLETEGGTVLADDARKYALALLAAAEVADQRNEASERDTTTKEEDG